MSYLATAKPGNKRKRQESQETRLNRVDDDAEDTSEETEIEESEDDDEPPRPSIHRRTGKWRPHGKALEDGIGMDLPLVPRKARSAIVKRPQQSAADPSTRAALSKVLNGSTSAEIIVKPGRRMKSKGTRLRMTKFAKEAMTEQEAEVAEVLFNLAKCIPSKMVLELTSENKLETGTEAGRSTVLTFSNTQDSSPILPSLPPPISTSDGTSSQTCGGPKRKNARVPIKLEEATIAVQVPKDTPTGGSQNSASPPRDLLDDTLQAETGTTHFLTDRYQVVEDEVHVEASKAFHTVIAHTLVPEPTAVEEAKPSSTEDQASIGKEISETMNSNGHSTSIVSSPAIEDGGAAIDTSIDRLSNRHVQPPSGDTNFSASKSMIDLMVLPLKISIDEEVGTNFTSPSKDAVQGKVVQEEMAIETESEDLKSKEKQADTDGELTVEGKEWDRKRTYGMQKCSIDGECKEEKLVTKYNVQRPSKASKTEVGTPKTDGSGSPTVSPFHSPTHPIPAFMVHLPPLLQPLPSFKRCAAHVYVAHMIYMEQQLARHPLWMNRRKVPATYFDTLMSKKPTSPQAGPAYGFPATQSDAGSTIHTTDNVTVGGTSMNGNVVSGADGSVITGDTGSGSTNGSVLDAATHAQYLQAIMQQNGFTSFSFPAGHFGSSFNGLPGQAAQYFNSPFYPVHIPPHLQPLAQQAANLSLPLKQQQGMQTLPKMSSQLPMPPLPPSLQQQHSQLPANASSSSQHHHKGSSTHNILNHAQKESNKKIPVAPNMYSLSQNMYSDISPSLSSPDLNDRFVTHGSTRPALSLHPQVFPLVGSVGHTTCRPQQEAIGHSQSQDKLVASTSMQKQQQEIQQPAGGSELQAKLNSLDPLASQPFSQMSTANLTRGHVGSGPLGLAPVATLMTPQGLTMFQGTMEPMKGHAQHQQGYVCEGQQQQHQKCVEKRALPVDEAGRTVTEAFKREYFEDRRSLKRGHGQRATLQKVELESSQGSPTGGIGGRFATNAGRTLNLMESHGPRSSGLTSTETMAVSMQLPQHTFRQVMAHTKAMAASSEVSTAAVNLPQVLPFSDQTLSPTTMGKISGPILPFPGQVAPTSQRPKQGQPLPLKLDQKAAIGVAISSGASSQAKHYVGISKSQGPEIRSQQENTSAAPPISGSATVPSSPGSSAPKFNGNTVSKSAASGKVVLQTQKSGTVSGKKSASVGPSTVSSQNTSAKASGHLHAQLSVCMPESSPASAHHQQLGTKSQFLQQQPGNYYKQGSSPQQQFRSHSFLQQQTQQYLHHTQQQQQALSQQAQQQSSQQFQQAAHPLNQHTNMHQHPQPERNYPHLQQQLQSASALSSGTLVSSGLTLGPPTLTLGRENHGNDMGNSNMDGISYLYMPTGPSPYSSKVTSSPGAPLPAGCGTERSYASGQGQQKNSPKNASSNHFQLASAMCGKLVEHKSSHDDISQEQTNGLCVLPNSSPARPPLITTPSSA